ncbi:hypothetical protein [Marinitoga litoralis]|nr:hypothetical protein [Marinitoga litoralis]MBM7559720.1 hypothetical protein [Marinitoga litoralis]
MKIKFFENSYRLRKGYITVANSAEIFEINSKDKIKINKLILR